MAGAFITWKPKSGPSKSLYFDACTSEGQTFVATATEHPVEEGANIADHIKKELDTVTLDVFVSNSPVEDLNDRGMAMSVSKIKVEKYEAPFSPTPGAVFSAVGGAVKGALNSLLGSGATDYAANVLKANAEFDAVADTLRVLTSLQDDSQLVDVVLPSRLHESMHLESITPERSATTGDGCTFKLSFKKITKVEVKLVTAPKPSEIRAAVAVKKGAQGPKTAKPSGPQSSVILSLYNRFAGSG